MLMTNKPLVSIYKVETKKTNETKTCSFDTKNY